MSTTPSTPRTITISLEEYSAKRDQARENWNSCKDQVRAKVIPVLMQVLLDADEPLTAREAGEIAKKDYGHVGSIHGMGSRFIEMARDYGLTEVVGMRKCRYGNKKVRVHAVTGRFHPRPKVKKASVHIMYVAIRGTRVVKISSERFTLGPGEIGGTLTLNKNLSAKHWDGTSKLPETIEPFFVNLPEPDLLESAPGGAVHDFMEAAPGLRPTGT